MKVYESGEFFGHRRGEQPGRPIPVGASFSYGGYEWIVPMVYRCRKGMVMDLCRKVGREQIAAFFKEYPREKEWSWSDEEQMEADARNPMEFEFRPRVEWNDESLPVSSLSIDSWYPVFPDEPKGEEAVQVRSKEWESENTEQRNSWIQAYGLDPEQGWNCYRLCFPIPFCEKRQPPAPLDTLNLSLTPNKVSYCCHQHIICQVGGGPVEFPVEHPFSKERYTLRIVSCEPRCIPEDMIKQGPLAVLPEDPRHYCVVSFDTEPPMPEGEIMDLRDCSHGDQVSPGRSVTIIGGAYGETSVFLDTGDGETASQKVYRQMRTSLTFEPVKELTLAVSIQSAPAGPGHVKLI